MKIVKTNWNEQPRISEPTIDTVKYDEDDPEQPGFGFELAWNTSNLLKPFVIIWFWRWRIQVGWLAE